MSRLVSRYEGYDSWKAGGGGDLNRDEGYGNPRLDDDGLGIHIGQQCRRGLCENCGDPQCDHFCHTSGATR